MQTVNAQWHQRELTVTQTHYFEPSFFIPHSIHFSDINNGYITGDGVILKYNGKEWLPVPIGEGFTPYLDAVYTVDSSHTFFAGNGGAFYKYDGQNLKKINTGTTNELLSISMIDSTEGWVSGVGGTILHIKGDSVTDYSIYPPFEMRHIYFDKPDHGWALCTRSFWNQGIQYDYVTLYEFKNNSWSEYYLTLGGIATGIDFTPSGEGYITTTENLYHYNKSNQSWEAVFPQTLANPITSVSMLNDNTGICMQANNSYLIYKNGLWSTHHADLSNMLAVQYVNSANIWAISTHNDGADYWDLKNHATNAWAGGENGTLLKYDGNSWKKVNINTTKGIIDIYFTDKDHGWLVGEGGLMYKYDGTSWSKDTAITTNDLYDIYMVNSNYGWVVGDSGTILQYINNDTTLAPRIANADIPSTIFPNPSSENTLIQFELKKPGNTVISLFNQQGKKVDTYKLGILEAGKFSKNINISALQDGTYFYEIISSGVRSIGKFIKVH